MPALTIAGSPTISGSTCLIDDTGPDRVQAPISLIQASQGWFAARLIAQAVAANGRRAMSWRPDVNNWIEIYQGSTAQTGLWRCTRSAAGVLTEVQGGEAISGDITVIGAWTSNQIKISLGGAAFTVGTNTSIPTLSGTLFDIGRLGDQVATSWLNSSMYWCAAGKGTLSDTDAATINGFGNTDPAWTDFPSAALISFLWPCTDFNYQDAPISSGVHGLTTLGVG